MSTSSTAGDRRQTATADEIKPLLGLCRAGKLFEVQEWIAAGKLVNLPPHGRKGTQVKSPLRVALELGFHSLVLVLLRGGAAIDVDRWSGSMCLALRERRFDLVRLLVEYGYDPAAVDMTDVFDTWNPELMDYFIDRGADVETGNPLARALCRRIRTAFRVLKKYRDQYSSFQEQANIALRYHCRQSNLKWASLMLWAGADPYAPGIYQCEEEPDPNYAGPTALGLAALYDFFEFFGLKQVRLDVTQPAVKEAARWACKGKGIDLLKKLLNLGLGLNDQENGGSSTLQSLLVSIGWSISPYRWHGFDNENGIDTTEARDKIEVVRLLAGRGVRWVPKDRSEINSVRRAFLKLTPRYTAEFVLIMSRHRGCGKDQVAALLRTPAMQSHVSKHSAQIARILSSWE
jgi:hypothetical protein